MIHWAAATEALPDPRPPKRVRDQSVYAQFHAKGHVCLHCGNRNVTAAHLLRGSKREDVLAALVPLCGHGSWGCHGAFDSSQAYTGDFGRKVTPEAVKASVAAFLRSEAGEAHAAYLISKLGVFGAERFVQKLEASA